MEKETIALLQELRTYAVEKGLTAAIQYHAERSHFMRFANSAISLNTSEDLCRLDIKVFEGRRVANVSLIVDAADLSTMKHGIDTARDMLVHVQTLSYEPSVPVYQEDVVDTRAYDPALAALSNEECLDYFNRAAAGLESEDLRLSGNFMNGEAFMAQISTKSPHTQFFASTDAQVTVVISSEANKWEVNGIRSAQKKSDLDADELHKDLAFMVDKYQNCPALQLPLGKYRVVLGPAAVGDVLFYLGWVGTNGGSMMRGNSFLKEEDIGKQVFSEKFNLRDDPERVELFAQSHDFCGVPRKRFPIFEAGVFKSFLWDQDSADEFGKQATGHDTPHESLVIDGGEMDCGSLEALAALPKDEDILYIPYIHYLNMVNRSKGLITGSSRFGALLFKKDGSIQVPYNVRLTQTFSDYFGERLLWLSKQQVVYNSSDSYDRRNPTAILLPRFICIDGIEISHANSSY